MTESLNGFPQHRSPLLIPSGGSTVGSMGSDDPLEAMKIGLELHLRPLGAGGATSWRCTPPVRQKALGAGKKKGQGRRRRRRVLESGCVCASSQRERNMGFRERELRERESCRASGKERKRAARVRDEEERAERERERHGGQEIKGWASWAHQLRFKNHFKIRNGGWGVSPIAL